MKDGGSLGFSIIGGTDHSCIPFGRDQPGIFISHVSNNLLVPYLLLQRSVMFSDYSLSQHNLAFMGTLYKSLFLSSEIISSIGNNTLLDFRLSVEE